jgi:hypothetical protein
MKPARTLAFVALASTASFAMAKQQTVLLNVPTMDCATTRPLMRRVFIACALFVALLLGFPLIAPLFY